MKLRDLDADFVGGLSADGKEFRRVETLAEAQGVMFQCPKCAAGKPIEEEDGRRFVRGAHMVLCWFNGRGVPDSQQPKPGRWNPSGAGLDDLTFVPPGAVSVQLLGGCDWHGFVSNGDAT
jgi:hypothetical protein